MLTRERIRINPRVTFILERASSTTRQHRTLAKKIATTWRQEFSKKSHTAPLVHLQESRKKNRSTSQLQFRSENTPAMIEADQTLLGLQQLANNNNSASLHNNINRISKLLKSLTTTMPTFDGKSDKVELFEDFFQTSLKIHNQLTEEDKIN